MLSKRLEHAAATQKNQREPLVNFGFGLPKLNDDKSVKGERIDLALPKKK